MAVEDSYMIRVSYCLAPRDRWSIENEVKTRTLDGYGMRTYMRRWVLW